MTFFEAYQEMKKGKTVSHSWDMPVFGKILLHYCISHNVILRKHASNNDDSWDNSSSLFIQDIEATDWEIVNE